MNTRLVASCLLIFIALPAILLAQTDDLILSPVSVSKEVVVNSLEPAFEDISTLRLTNTSGRDLQLRWTKTVEDQPGGWKSYLYAKKPGFGPYSAGQYAQADEQRDFTLKAGATMEFYLILQPSNKSGKGRIKIEFSSITRPNLSLGSSTFDFNVLNQQRATSNTSRPNPASRGTTRLYPNPAVENFFVELPRGVGAGKVEIFNTLGRKLKTYATPDPEKGYLINDLPEGIYLINVYDDRGEKLKTLRLLHRRFGA